MADFRKAGTDRGDIEAELRNLLISAKIKREEYLSMIEELEKDELEYDLAEYKDYYGKEIEPILKRAEMEMDDYILKMAQELKYIYMSIIKEIESKLKSL